MKKTNLIIALALGLAGTQVYGQGTINFANTGVSAVTNSLTMVRLVTGTTFRVALYYMPDQAEAPTLDQMLASGVTLGNAGSIVPTPGFYSAGTRTTPNSTAALGFCWLQVRAWETAFGGSYEAAVANTTTVNGRLALAGHSNILRLKTGDPVNNVPPGALTGFGLQGFIVTVVPEPTAIGLAAMGIGALLLLRRKK